MIKKRLQLIYSDGRGSAELVSDLFFSSWKELHQHLFEHGLYQEFQIVDHDGKIPLYYKAYYPERYELRWSKEVPGSVVFEIVNKHASAKL